MPSSKDPEAKRAYMKAYRKANAEKLRASKKAWDEANAEHLLAYRTQYHHAKKDDVIYKEKARQRASAWYKTNKARAIAQAKIYHAARADKITKYLQAYYEEHKEELNARNRDYYKKMYQVPTYREKMLKHGRVYRQEHPEKGRDSTRAYRLAHPEKASSYAAARRARKALAPIDDLSHAQWLEIKAAYGHRCVYCGRKMQRLTRDHITPVGPEGPHTLHNVVPACGSCNSKKQTKPPLCPVQPLLLTIAPARKKKAS